MKISDFSGYREVEISSNNIPIILSLYEVSPEKPSILFLPGTMVHPLFYDAFLTRLADAGFNVAGVHFISHGKSPRIKKDFVFSDMVQNVRDAITFCKARWPGKLMLMGSSQGSIVAMAAAGGEERINALLLHDLILPELKETMHIIKAPRWMLPFYTLVPLLMRFAARLFPTFQVPITSYLEAERVSASPQVIETFLNDPLALKSYPLSFLASLFSARLENATDGTLRCPVILIAAKGDPLFTYSYICRVYEKIKAPEKEMISYELPYHMLFVEAVDEVAGPIVERLKNITA